MFRARPKPTFPCVYMMSQYSEASNITCHTLGGFRPKIPLFESNSLNMRRSNRYPILHLHIYTAVRRYCTETDSDEHVEEVDFSQGVLNDLQVQHEMQRRAKMIPSPSQYEQMISNILPSDQKNNRAALSALREYFRKTPINEYIPCERVVITSVETPDGKDIKPDADKRKFSIQDAIVYARSRDQDVVMLGENQGVGYCKIRNEVRRALKQIDNHLTTGNSPSGNIIKSQGKPVEYSIRDVIAHNDLVWRSQRIRDDLSKRKQVRIVCAKFLSPPSAVSKIREFLDLIKIKTAEVGVGHSAMQIVISENELGVILHPTGGKETKHPSDSDWVKHQQRLQKAVENSGRDISGTYVRSKEKKLFSTGTRFTRQNRYGEALDDRKVEVLKYDSEDVLRRKLREVDEKLQRT